MPLVQIIAIRRVLHIKHPVFRFSIFWMRFTSIHMHSIPFRVLGPSAFSVQPLHYDVEQLTCGPPVLNHCLDIYV